MSLRGEERRGEERRGDETRQHRHWPSTGRFPSYGTARHDTIKASVHPHLPAVTDRIFSSNANDGVCPSLSLHVGNKAAGT
jgi:hypothetical protein